MTTDRAIRPVSRGGLGVVAAVMVGCLSALAARAEDWPSRPITMVVAFSAGSASDLVGRMIGARMSETLGQPIVIENISGAGGMTGMARVAKSAPDGYTFAIGSVAEFAMNQVVYKKPLYNAVTDFEPIGLILDQPILLVTRNDFPANDLQSFIAYTKANHDKMQFGSSGVGGASHLPCAMINAAMDVDVTHVTYRGSAQVMQDLMAGRIDYFCPLGAAAAGPIESKSVKPIAVLAHQRSPLFPSIPSSEEQGLGSVAPYFWTGFFLPKGVPTAIVQRMNDAASRALATPGMDENLRRTGSTIVPSERRTPEYLKALVISEIKYWDKTVKASGVSLD